MSAWSRQVGLFSPLIAVAVGACTPIEKPRGQDPLEPVTMSPDSCTLDVFFVRFPFGAEEPNGPMWDEIDEQCLPCELRQRLLRNGFRVGRTGGRMPPALARLLELDGKPAPTGQCQTVSLAQLGSMPTVTRRHLPVRAGRRAEIVASDVCDQWDVLELRGDAVCGMSYRDVQAVFAVAAQPESDGRVRLELVPELPHGDPKPHYVGQQYALRIETSRSRRVFDDLAISAALSPGEMLVLSSLPNPQPTVGRHFLTQEVDGKEEQELLVIRLSQTQHDDLFSPDELAGRVEFQPDLAVE